MTIELISPEQYAEILTAYENCPELFLQNKGYECIVKKNLSEEAKKQLEKIEAILKNHIKGFVSFSNFCLSKDGDLRLRFEYRWDASFTGVGYLLLSELLNGFNEKEV